MALKPMLPKIYGGNTFSQSRNNKTNTKLITMEALMCGIICAPMPLLYTDNSYMPNVIDYDTKKMTITLFFLHIGKNSSTVGAKSRAIGAHQHAGWPTSVSGGQGHWKQSSRRRLIQNITRESGTKVIWVKGYN